MGKKILVVDDEEDILTSMKMLLEANGYDVKTADNGLGAIEMLRKETFDLVLLDIIMPEVSGRDVLARIRADRKLKDQKVAFLTVVKLTTAGESILKELNPVEYFQKPIETADFEKRLKRILEG